MLSLLVSFQEKMFILFLFLPIILVINFWKFHYKFYVENQIEKL